MKLRKLLGLAALGLSTSFPAFAQPTEPWQNAGQNLSIDPATGNFTYQWWGKSGRTYFIQSSENLVDWSYVPIIEPGIGDWVQWGFSLAGDKLFLRLEFTDLATTNAQTADFDGDGVDNLTEIINGTDFFGGFFDADSDGLSDDWEMVFGDKDGSLDLDGDGYSAYQEQLAGTSDDPAQGGASSFPVAPFGFAVVDLGRTADVGYPMVVANSGKVLLSLSGWFGQAHRWSPENGLEELNLDEGVALDMSNDGLVVGAVLNHEYGGEDRGYYSDGTETVAAYWPADSTEPVLVDQKTEWGISFIDLVNDSGDFIGYRRDESLESWTVTWKGNIVSGWTEMVDDVVGVSVARYYPDQDPDDWDYGYTFRLRGTRYYPTDLSHSGLIVGETREYVTPDYITVTGSGDSYWGDNGAPFSGWGSRDIPGDSVGTEHVDFQPKVITADDTVFGERNGQIGWYADGEFYPLPFVQWINGASSLSEPSKPVQVALWDSLLIQNVDDPDLGTYAALTANSTFLSFTYDQLVTPPLAGGAPQSSPWTSIYADTISDNGAWVAGTAVKADTSETHAVAMVQLELSSEDRMLAGSLDMSHFGDVRNRIGIQFQHSTTGEILGVFDIGNPETEFYIYEDFEALLSDEQIDEFEAGTLDPQSYEQDVVFIRDPDESDRIHFFTTFEAYGQVNVHITLDDAPFATATHELSESLEFGDLIEFLDARIDDPEMVLTDLPADPHPDDFAFDPGFSDLGPDPVGDLLTIHRPGTMAYPGQPISEASEDDPLQLLLSLNDDNDSGRPEPFADYDDALIDPADNDVAKLVLRLPAGIDSTKGTFTVTTNAGSAIRIFATDGQSALLPASLTVDLSQPAGPLASLASEGTLTLWVEGLAEFGDIEFKANYTATGQSPIEDEVHFQTVGQLAANLYQIFEVDPKAVLVAGTDIQTVRFTSDGPDLRVQTPQFLSVGRRDVRNRNLSTSASIPLFRYIRVGGQLSANYAKGFFDGALDGAKSDYETLSGIPGFVKDQIQAFWDSPIQAAKAVVDPIRILIDMTAEERSNLFGQVVSNFLSSAEENTAWQMELGDSALQFYVSGYTTGFATEQLVSITVGAGAISNFAKGFKYVLNLSRTGQSVVQGPAAVNRFKGAALRSLSRFAANATRARDIQQFFILRIERFRFNGRSAHEIIQTSLDASDGAKLNHMILSKEMRDTVNDLDNLPAYGFVHYKRLAHLLDLLGPENFSEDVVIGFVRLNRHLVDQDLSDGVSVLGNRYNSLVRATDADSSSQGKLLLKETLENYKRDTDNASGLPPLIASSRISAVYPQMYHYMPEPDFRFLSATGNGTFIKDSFIDADGLGHYLTPDLYSDPISPRVKLQLPPKIVNGAPLPDSERARFRCKVEIVEIENEIGIPLGKDHQTGLLTENFEAITAQNPQFGIGGAPQFNSTRALTITEVFDTVQGRALTDAEILQLIQSNF